LERLSHFQIRDVGCNFPRDASLIPGLIQTNARRSCKEDGRPSSARGRCECKERLASRRNLQGSKTIRPAIVGHSARLNQLERVKLWFVRSKSTAPRVALSGHLARAGGCERSLAQHPASLRHLRRLRTEPPESSSRLPLFAAGAHFYGRDTTGVMAASASGENQRAEGHSLSSGAKKFWLPRDRVMGFWIELL